MLITEVRQRCNFYKHRQTLYDESMSMVSESGRGILARRPNGETLDRYQETVSRQVVYDDTGNTIKGKPALEYMHSGIVEELQEPWDPDRVYPDYNRMGALLQELDGFAAGNVSDGAVALHRKEFGDISWYMANRLALQGISFSSTIESGKEYRERAADEAPYASPEFIVKIEELFPGLVFAAHSHELQTASREAIDVPITARLAKLQATAGQLTLSMCQVVAVRLNTDYEAILEQNIAKISQRVKNGTVFDKSGGDAR